VRAQEYEAKKKIIEAKKLEDPEATFHPKTNQGFVYQRPNFEQWNNTGNHMLFLNSLVEKGQYASRKDKNREEYEFEKQYD